MSKEFQNYAKVLHIVVNPYTHDSRVLRAAEAGRELFGGVYVYALHEKGLPLSELQSGVSVRRFHLRTRRLSKAVWVQGIKFCELMIRMIVSGVKLRPKLVHAHDLAGLIVGYPIAKLCGARLIYDSHEYWADIEGHSSFPGYLRRMLMRAEQVLARAADGVIAVSAGIAARLQQELRVPSVVVVRNVPEYWRVRNEELLLRKKLGIREQDIVFLYQGGIAEGRGVKELLLAYLSAEIQESTLVFMGDGPMVPELKSIWEQAKAPESVAFLPTVPQSELPKYTSDADIGLLPLLRLSQKLELSLPNKLFEYVQGGLAIIASDLTEIGAVMRKDKLGLLCPPGDIAALTSAMQRLGSSRQTVRIFKNAANAVRKKYCWEVERIKLLTMYQELLDIEPGKCVGDVTSPGEGG